MPEVHGWRDACLIMPYIEDTTLCLQYVSGASQGEESGEDSFRQGACSRHTQETVCAYDNPTTATGSSKRHQSWAMIQRIYWSENNYFSRQRLCTANTTFTSTVGFLVYCNDFSISRLRRGARIGSCFGRSASALSVLGEGTTTTVPFYLFWLKGTFILVCSWFNESVCREKDVKVQAEWFENLDLKIQISRPSGPHKIPAYGLRPKPKPLGRRPCLGHTPQGLSSLVHAVRGHFELKLLLNNSAKRVNMSILPVI